MGRSRTPRAQSSTSTPQQTSPDPLDGEERVGRRALMRRAATVAAAGIGGIAATEMLTASPAAAASGDPLLLGGDGTATAVNNAQTHKTIVTSTAPSATFDIRHSGNIANLRLAPIEDSVAYGDPATGNGDAGGTMLGGELLNLTEAVPGSAAGIDTLFWMAGDNSANDLSNLAVVLTTATGTVFVPYGPFRALDTRNDRTLLASTTVLDSLHRLRAGQTLELQLDSFVQFAYAVHFNVTAVTPVGTGFLTAFGSQTTGGGPARPLASNINFTKNVNIANHSVSPLSDRLSLFIYASQTTHVIVDIQGWTLPDFSFLLANAGAATAGSAKLRAQQAAGLGVVRRPVQRNLKNNG
jgi:hypothetical protein